MVHGHFDASKFQSFSPLSMLSFLSAADQSRMMQEQMTMQAGGVQDPKQAFKAEWEALEVTEHTWALKNAEQDMMTAVGPTQDNLYHQSKKMKTLT